MSKPVPAWDEFFSRIINYPQQLQTFTILEEKKLGTKSIKKSGEKKVEKQKKNPEKN